MKRLLICLAPWMAMTVAAQSEIPRPAQVAFTHVGNFRDNVWRVGDECYVAQRSTDSWGWNLTFDGDRASIQVDGVKVDAQAKRLGPQRMIPLRSTLLKFGADSAWNEDTLVVWSSIRSIEVSPQSLLIDSALPVKVHVTSLASSSKVIVDLLGARLPKESKVQQEKGVKVGQTDSNTVRIIIETDDAKQFRALEGKVASHIEVGEFKPEPKPEIKPTPTVTEPPKAEPPKIQQTTVDPPKQEVPPVKQEDIGHNDDQDHELFGPPALVSPLIGPIQLVGEDAKTATLLISSKGIKLAAPTITRLEPSVIQIILNGCRYEGPESPELNSEAIDKVVIKSDKNGVFATVFLKRPLGVEFAQTDLGVMLTLWKPEVGDGKLAGKTIVVDAGHGGYDTGTQHKPSNLSEKDLTLPIAKQVAQMLLAEGATVIMTRKIDEFIPLGERAAIANRNNADLFISVHINSNMKADSRSGTITFYHNDDPIRHVLADCIQAEVGKLNLLPSIGTWSDQRIYPKSGFSVLRNSQMPGVLVEVGFMNHTSDRTKMVQESFQKAMAGAIVKGIKVYLGNGKE